ncbi:GntR family transcriptional regulator [Micromonospora sp. NPDC047465]|uniref:GntR family transcriptional regulator n=1 Tax=Micromonospora sp. NPDC047465 TaxID=3154813 RepID=UPI0033C3724C
MSSKYDRVAADLRSKIRAGRFAPDTRLPAETDLARDYGVTVNTMRRALELLLQEGLIDKRQGAGNYVRQQRPPMVRTTERYQWEKDRVRLPADERRAAGATERDTGLNRDDLDFYAEYTQIPATAEIAAVFNVPEGTRLLRRVYHTRKRSERAPMGTGASYLVYDHIARNPDLLNAENEPWPGGTQHQLSTVGIEVGEIVDEVVARTPTPDEALVLDIPSGSAVLVLRKISIDTTGRVVEVADAIWPGSRIKLSYNTKLKAWN